jgi:shikimate kinase
MSNENPRNPAPEEPAHRQRARSVEDAVHSGEMECLSVTPAFDEDAAAYVNGTITLDEFGSRVRARSSRG